jgi:tetratricopeptide (TPR) repeat protein
MFFKKRIEKIIENILAGNELNGSDFEFLFCKKWKEIDILLEKDFVKGVSLITMYDEVYLKEIGEDEEAELDVALYYCKKCLEIGNRNGEFERGAPWLQPMLLCSMGNIYARKGYNYEHPEEIDKAIECYEKGMKLTGEPILLGNLCKGMAEALGRKGKDEEYIEWLKKAKDWYVISENKEKIEKVLIDLAMICGLAGRCQEAESYHNEALAIKKGRGENPQKASLVEKMLIETGKK